MPTHALLGATGATGSAVLRCIISDAQPDLLLNVFVRSKEKLISNFPALERTTNINVISAELSDQDALTACLKDADVIYNCIATNASTRGVKVARSAAAAIVTALDRLRRLEDHYKPPLLVFNRSMALNPLLDAGAPKVLEKFALFCLGYLFNDLTQACEMYKEAASQSEHQLLRFVLVDPPGLHDPQGTDCTGFKLVMEGAISPAINYADLGAAFVEIAARGNEFEGAAVGVSATGKVRESPLVLLRYLLQGLWARINPF